MDPASGVLLAIIAATLGPEVVKAGTRLAFGDPTAELAKEQRKRAQTAHYGKKSAIASLTETEAARQDLEGFANSGQPNQSTMELMEVVRAMGSGPSGNDPREALNQEMGDGFSDRVSSAMGYHSDPIIGAYGIPQEELA